MIIGLILKRQIGLIEDDGLDYFRYCFKKGSSSPPPAPDPAATAAAQGAINKETAIAQARLNQVNEYTPYGQSEYTPRLDGDGNPVVNDGIPAFDRTTSLDPADQARLDQDRAIAQYLGKIGTDQLGRIENNMGEEFNYEGLPSYPEADANERKRIEDTLYGSYKSRLDPRFDQEQQRMDTKLANQGITQGSDAYKRESDNFGRTKNDAYQQASADATNQGGNEMSRLFGLSKTARQDLISERLTKRNQPLNELVALLGGAPSVAQPQFAPQPTSGIAPADITGPTALQYQGQLAGWQNSQNANQGMFSSLFNLGGQLGSARINKYSDRRLKTNIRRIGMTDGGLPVYTFRYKWGGPVEMGVMADDVEKTLPAAVGSHNGFKTVNYAQVN